MQVFWSFHLKWGITIGILFEMETEEAQTTLRQAQGERSGVMPSPPFVLSLSKHERRSSPQMI